MLLTPGNTGEQQRQPAQRVFAEPRAALDRDPPGHPAGGGQLGARFQRPLRHQREDHPLGSLPVHRRPAATRRIARPISSRSHSWPGTHAPPIRRESSTSTSPAAAAATACPGSRNREIEATSRAAPPGRPCRHGRSRGSPWRPDCRYEGAARCALAAGTARRCRPCRPAGSHAGTRLQVKPSQQPGTSDTPDSVCLQQCAVSANPQAYDQDKRSRSSLHVPVIFGSPG